MAKSKNNRFVLGNDIPEWIKPYSTNGRIKFEYDDELHLTSATIQSPTGTKKVNIGDAIISASSGLIVIPKTNNVK